MGLFNFLSRKTIRIENEFFGQMTFMGSKNEPESYFECRRHFKPSNEIIDIGIEGNISGPTRIQIDFFKKIEDDYDKIFASIIPLIENEFRNWKENFKIVDFRKEFEPVYLRIPKCVSKEIIWEIAFESEHDRNHTFTLTIHDLEAKEILIDG